jgi:hypothetical protein
MNYNYFLKWSIKIHTDANSQWFMPVNISSSEGWDQEDQGSRPAWADSSRDPISNITRAKWTGGVAQAAEYLLCKCEALSSNSSPNKTKQKKLTINFHTNVLT